MYYYLAAFYDVHDLCLDEATDLQGPFSTPEERASKIEEVGEEDGWDDGDMIVNVTLLEVQDGKIVRTESGLFVSEENSYQED